jgi:hypothetical protein
VNTDIYAGVFSVLHDLHVNHVVHILHPTKSADAVIKKCKKKTNTRLHYMITINILMGQDALEGFQVRN